MAKAPQFDFKFEIAVIPVSDVDRAKAFYTKLGWRLDADFAAGEHEKRTGGKHDDDWPDWYADYIVKEQAGEALPK